MDNIQHFQQIVKEMAETYAKKNKDYGNSFDKTLDKWGPNIALARLEDKLNRITQLTLSGKAEVNDESIEDTLKDMATYAIMFLMWRQNKTSGNVEPTKSTGSAGFVREFLEGFQNKPTKEEEWKCIEAKLQRYLRTNRIVRKGLNNGGWNPTYILGKGDLTSLRVGNNLVFAHFDNIIKDGKRVGSGTADVVYPIKSLSDYGFIL